MPTIGLEQLEEDLLLPFCLNMCRGIFSPTFVKQMLKASISSAILKLRHSDRGSQYTAADYRDLFAQSGIVVSMSGKGDCYDNALMESFLVR